LNAKDKVIKDQIDQSHKEALLAVLDSELLADSRNLAQELAKYRAECKEPSAPKNSRFVRLVLK